ncbi:hypothetical protein MP638_001099 [Amoeboaphelidium occidentale]|nr:hypothetical protein MP638_001099 [Amoeboaphelidium occidentale]
MILLQILALIISTEYVLVSCLSTLPGFDYSVPLKGRRAKSGCNVVYTYNNGEEIVACNEPHGEAYFYDNDFRIYEDGKQKSVGHNEEFDTKRSRWYKIELGQYLLGPPGRLSFLSRAVKVKHPYILIANDHVSSGALALELAVDNGKFYYKLDGAKSPRNEEMAKKNNALNFKRNFICYSNANEYDLLKAVKDFSKDGNAYSMINKNCVHFVRFVLGRLCGEKKAMEFTRKIDHSFCRMCRGASGFWSSLMSFFGAKKKEEEQCKPLRPLGDDEIPKLIYYPDLTVEPEGTPKKIPIDFMDVDGDDSYRKKSDKVKSHVVDIWPSEDEDDLIKADYEDVGEKTTETP